MKSYGPNRHEADIDHGRGLANLSGVDGTITTRTPVPINSQAWTVEVLVFVPRLGGVMRPWQSSPGAQARLSVAADGRMLLSNGTDSVQTPAGFIVPGGFRSLMYAIDAARNVELSQDGEVGFAGQLLNGGLPTATNWIWTAVAQLVLPPGWRIVRWRAWAQRLTASDRAKVVYRGRGPTPVFDMLPTATPLGTVLTDRIGGIVADTAGLTWTDSVPALPPRPVPDGYSLICDTQPNGSAALALYCNPVMPASVLNALRGARQWTIAHQINFQGNASANFRSFALGTDANLGLGFRWVTSGVGTDIRLTFNGRLGAMSGSASEFPSSGVLNLRAEAMNRPVWVHATADYDTGVFLLGANGWPRVQEVIPTADRASGYRPDAVQGQDRIWMGAMFSAVTAANRVRTLQRGWLIAPRAMTSTELRALALRGRVPPDALWYQPLREGVGRTSFEAITGTACDISVDENTNPITAPRILESWSRDAA